MTRIDIIGGFLGSGKTSLLKKWISSPLYRAFTEKTLIVENEFGEVSLDGMALSDVGVGVSELSSGCICCSISEDFSLHLDALINTHNPERIIIEPSGVAKLSEVVEMVKNLQRQGRAHFGQAVTLLDASSAQLYLENFGDFYKDQIIHANQLIINRNEFLSESDFKHLLGQLNTLNANAPIHLADEMTEASTSLIMDMQFDAFSKMDFFSMVRPKHNHHHDIGIESLTLRFEHLLVDANPLEAILNDFLTDHATHIIRAKGLLKTASGGVKFDWAGNRLEISPANTHVQETILCFIGPQPEVVRTSPLLQKLGLSEVL